MKGTHWYFRKVPVTISSTRVNNRKTLQISLRHSHSSSNLFRSKGLESALAEKDDYKCVELYVSLCSLNKQLQHSKCQHLVSFLNDTVHFWHNLLKQKFSTWVLMHRVYNCGSSTDKMYSIKPSRAISHVRWIKEPDVSRTISEWKQMLQLFPTDNHNNRR